MDGSHFDVAAARAQFPALGRAVGGVLPVFFDNPAGTQVPSGVLEAIRESLVEANANLDGAFHTSARAAEMLWGARAAMADLLNAPSPETIVFGPNMTSLTMAMSRSIGKTLSAGDEVVVTWLDHDANVSPWLLMAEDHNLTVRWVDVDTGDCTLDMAGLAAAINERTKVVAVGYASNAVGTINDVQEMVRLAREAGALSYIDAVHYSPHGSIDVQALDCDFLVCSPYKFFGPHMGVLYGKHEHLERLPAYKVRPAPDAPPDRWEMGTQSHEAIHGLTAAVDYLAWIGETWGGAYLSRSPDVGARRQRLVAGMAAIAGYERTLGTRLLEGLAQIEGVRVYGITALDRLAERVPTFGLTVEGRHPRQVAVELGESHIYVWDGDYYAVGIVEKLGLADKGGMVRVGPVHYNTPGEVDRFLAELEGIARR